MLLVPHCILTGSSIALPPPPAISTIVCLTLSHPALQFWVETVCYLALLLTFAIVLCGILLKSTPIGKRSFGGKNPEPQELASASQCARREDQGQKRERESHTSSDCAAPLLSSTFHHRTFSLSLPFSPLPLFAWLIRDPLASRHSHCSKHGFAIA